MVTPTKYQELLKKGIISEDMFSDVLYSIDKRAQHHSSMQRQYRAIEKWNRSKNYPEKYNNAKKSEYRKVHFNRQKEIMLDLLEPKGIRTSIHYEQKLLYEYDDEYREMSYSPYVTERGIEDIDGSNISDERKHNPSFVRYFTYKKQRLDWELGYVFRVKHIIVRIPRYDIYLYYECGNHSYHQPVRIGIEGEAEYERVLEGVAKRYPNLEVLDEPDLSTQALNVPSVELEDILSSQFTDKVVALIESGNYVFKKEGSYAYMEET